MIDNYPKILQINTCLKKCILYFFRGIKAEKFNPTTGQFEEGPDMPLFHNWNPCAALTPRGTIVFLGRYKEASDTEDNKFYEFDPAAETFTQLPDMPGQARDMVCGVVNVPADQGEQFFAFGGHL